MKRLIASAIVSMLVLTTALYGLPTFMLLMMNGKVSTAATTAGAPSFTDTFVRADANPMSTTSSDGHTWTSGPGAMNDMQILTNSLCAGSSSSCGAVVATPTFGNDYTVTGTAKTSTSSLWGVCSRFQPSSASCYLLYLDAQTTLTLYKATDTGTIAFSALGASFTITQLNAGDTIALQVSGTTLTVFRNGVSQGTRTDSSYTSGQPGSYSSSSTTNSALSNFNAQ